jgi:hypothetical protein
MKEWYKDFIGVYENAFSVDLCNQIISLMDNSPLGERGLNEGGGLKKQDKGSHLEFYDKNLSSQVNEFLHQNILPLYTKKYPIFNMIGPCHIPYFKIQKTIPTEGYHEWHCESNGWFYMNRVGVYTIYLNDVAEGGETEFLYQSLRVKPTQGTVCIFPAGYTHVHRGNPPLLGEKYIITGWIEYIDPKLLENQNSN